MNVWGIIGIILVSLVIVAVSLYKVLHTSQHAENNTNDGKWYVVCDINNLWGARHSNTPPSRLATDWWVSLEDGQYVTVLGPYQSERAAWEEAAYFASGVEEEGKFF